jgi:pimeloyl-ACP methyl ester carboxylesterase
VVGLVLSRSIEPGVSAEWTSIAGDVPAIRFVPGGAAARRPKALLAHGVTASKETLFRLGEALAAAGYEAYAIDLPGHGDSPLPFRPSDNVQIVGKAAAAIGPLDVLGGHSMGAYAGAGAVRAGTIRPRRFVAFGAAVSTVPPGPPPTLLAGAWEELVGVERLRALARESGGTLVASPWSDHALEPYDPVLVDAAVQVACAAVGSAAPPPPTRWRVRLAGFVLATTGAVGSAYALGHSSARLRALSGVVVACASVAALAFAGRTWVGAAPGAHHVPAQLFAIASLWGVCEVLGRARAPRWSLVAAGLVLAAGATLVAGGLFALLAWLLVMVLGAGAAIAWLAERGSTRRQGDVAFAIVVGYALGQWMPSAL